VADFRRTAALLALNELISRSGAGVLAGALAPFKARIEGLLSDQGSGKALPIERIRVIPWGERKLNQQVFRIVAGAVLERHQLRFRYRARTTNTDSRRTVSPQRLTHYRDNWYLDVWDHDREALRSFAVDRIVEPQALDAAAIDVAENDLNELLASSYGIFAGKPKGLGHHPLLAARRALGRRRALAFAATRRVVARRPLRAEGALLQLARIADGRAQVRARCRDRFTAAAARGNENPAAAGDEWVSTERLIVAIGPAIRLATLTRVARVQCGLACRGFVVRSC
jgi:predicted DNA-binding transcriptional regulator YafY